MQLLEGRKRFFLFPSASKGALERLLNINDWSNVRPVFTSDAMIIELWNLGLQIAEFNEGDLLYFPPDWFHEVHNLTPCTKAITNAVLNPFFLALTDLSIIGNLRTVFSNLRKIAVGRAFEDCITTLLNLGVSKEMVGSALEGCVLMLGEFKATINSQNSPTPEQDAGLVDRL